MPLSQNILQYHAVNTWSSNAGIKIASHEPLSSLRERADFAEIPKK